MRTHGRDSTYRIGCRCEACTEANSRRCRESRLKAQQREPVRHGTATAYDFHKCRCWACREANTKACRAKRARARERRLAESQGGRA